MPHLVIEHSSNITADIKAANLADIMHHVLGAHGLFKLQDIKTRVYVADDFLVGEDGNKGSFVHITLSIKQGRTAEQRQAVAAALLELMQGHVKTADQMTVDIREMDADAYQKFVR